MNSFNDKYEELSESFKPIKTVKKSFYPRNFNLSEDFVGSFKKEYKRLIDEGIHPNKALTRITKALLFHARD